MNNITHPFLSLPGIPEASKSLLWTLLTERPMPQQALEGIVTSYGRVIEGLAKKDARVNGELGKAITHALTTILARVDDRTGDDDYRVIQAAVRYFVVENDGGGNDFATLDGLVDDARVVNSMLRWLGRDDLTVDVTKRPARTPSRIFGGAALSNDRR